jgi:isopenicillin-N N-acyltransferase like protein
MDGVQPCYPHVRVEGDSLERGRQYGEQARRRIVRSREAYEQIFAHVAGWDWERVSQDALRFADPIARFNSGYFDEIRGLAEGSGLPLADILALNVRTEIMYAAKARKALAEAGPARERQAIPAQGECTAFAALPEAVSSGHVLIGQNWDWRLHSFETVVVLEAHQEGKPDYVTVVEAGLLAKSGMNSAGIGVAVNSLVTEQDRGEPGVPFHVLLRAVLDATTITDALAVLQSARRSSSANYLIASHEGIALDVEAAPGDFSRLSILLPIGGILLHTNHMLVAQEGVRDLALWAAPDSVVRLQRARAFVERNAKLSPPELMAMLADHADYPFGICAHADERQPLLDQGATIASIIMDLNERRLWLADGQPCRTPYRELDYGEFLSRLGSSAAAEPSRRS